jgi:hypothetical protein
MFTDDDDHWDLTFGIIVVGIIVTGLIVIAQRRDAQPVAAGTLPETEVSSVPAPIDPPMTPSARVEPTQKIIATVYECVIGGERVMSDRPCSANAAIREIAAPNRMDAQDTSHLFDRVDGSVGFSVQTRGSSTDSVVPVNGAACDSIQAEIDRIDAQMRRGYSSHAGEYYRERLRSLRSARWDANCRWRKK